MSVVDQPTTRNDEAKDRCDQPKLQELFDRVQALGSNPILTRLPTIARVLAAFEQLLRQLVDKPDCLNQSVQRTMAQTVDLLCTLFDSDGREVDLVTARALAVDDQQIALRSVMNALEKANLKSQALSDPTAALSVAQEWQFDLIVLDIEMPGMTGVELCAKLRTLPNYKKTPILFVTSASDFENRAKVCRSGGNDLIAKPFLATELCLKALTLIVKSKAV
jgi:CheY-like chemotaxis protein